MRDSRKIVLVALVIVLALAAWTWPAQAGGSVLTGTVLDSDGEPLARVLVRIRPAVRGVSESLQDKTGADGTFRIEDVGKGPHHVTVQSVKTGDNWAVDLEDIEVKVKEGKTTEIEICMEPK